MKTAKKEGQKTIPCSLKKYTVFIAVLSLHIGTVNGQSQTYDNFEGNKILNYGARTGILDTAVRNPAGNKINSSEKCALYIRNKRQKFDNIKMSLNGKLADISDYATYKGVPPRLKMKIYTSAPAGTLVEILLGSKGKNNQYPAGTHSQYQAYTTVSNAWEELSFKFSEIPIGSETTTTQIDQLTILFSPNSSVSDTFYFDDITGPSVISGKPDTKTSTVTATKNESKK